MRVDQERRFLFERDLGLKQYNHPSEIKRPNPGFSFTWLIAMLVPILKVVMSAITPIFRRALEEFLIEKYKEALETTNPYDDFLFEFFLRVLSIPIPTNP